MNGMNRGLYAVFVALWFMAPRQATAAVVVRLVPANQTVDQGDTFTVDIVADIDEPVAGWGLDLTDVTPGIVSVSQPPVIGPAWQPTASADGDGLAALAFPDAVLGNDVLLATVTLSADAAGQTDLTPGVTPGDNTEGFLLDAGGFDTVTFQSGQVTVDPPPPLTPVVVRLVPSVQTVERNQVFNVDIVADIVDPVIGWGLDFFPDAPGVLSQSGDPAIGPEWLPAAAADEDGLAGLAFPGSVAGTDILLATVTMTADTEGETDLILEATPADLTEGFLLDAGGFAPVTFESGHVTVVSGPPVVVRFATPDRTVFLNQAFTIDIVADIGPPVGGWGLDLTIDTPGLILPNGAPIIGPDWFAASTVDGDGLAGLAFPDAISGNDILLASVPFTAEVEGETDLFLGVTPGDFTEGFIMKPAGFAEVIFESGHLTVIPDPGLGDCNENAVLDGIDIANGDSDDCNGNGVPDECEISADSTAPGGPFFCTENCDPDCDNNGVPDECQIDQNSTAPGGPFYCVIDCDPDCNDNGIPDACDPDCNNNDIPDLCEVPPSAGFPGGLCQSACAADCNENGLPDECDIGGASTVLYAVEQGQQSGSVAGFHTVDPADGSLTLIDILADLNGDAFGSVGLSTDPTTGELYVAVSLPSAEEGGQNNRTLAVVDTDTAALTVIGLFGEQGISDIAFRSDGTLYAVTDNQAVQRGEILIVNTSDASVTSTGIIGGDGSGQSVAFQPGTGLLFHTFGGNMETINVDTQAISPVGTSGVTFTCITFHPSGNPFFGFSRSFSLGGPPSSNFYSIDPGNAAAAQLSVGNLPRMTGLAFSAGQSASTDCNQNGIPDECDIVDETSSDCNGNGLPDECEIDENSTAPGGPFFCIENCNPDCNDNGIPDDCDIAVANSPDCNQNGIPDECEVPASAGFPGGLCQNDCAEDCDENGVPDACQIDENSTAPGGPFYCIADCDPDCNDNGIPDSCEPDCDGNGVPDECDLGGGGDDCNNNGTPDACEIDENSTAPGGPFFCTADCDPDCNNNGIPDECDISGGGSDDCNNDGTPDECEIREDSNAPGGPFFCTVNCDFDCNNNGIPDACDIAGGGSNDCDNNGLPDECQIDENSTAPGGPFFCTFGCDPDCNNNGIPDACEPDCNNNNIPDECEIDENSTAPGGPFFCAVGCDPDCNNNGIPDECDISGGASDDCNNNDIPDECEIDQNSTAPGGPFFCTSGCDPDCNNNGIPDECDPDCNNNNIPDNCDIDENSTAPGGPFYCTADCDPDCNENGIPDECDISGGGSSDCNNNEIPDECEIDENSTAPGGPFFCTTGCDPDCNDNGVPDDCDTDCNNNGTPDTCEVPASPGCPIGTCVSGCAEDCNENCIPDDCEGLGACCVTVSGPPDCDSTTETECNVISLCACQALGGTFLGFNTQCTQTITVPQHQGPPSGWSHSIVTVSTCPTGSGGTAPCVDGPFKIDPWITAQDGSSNCENFDTAANPGACPIPADFFGPGSDPFTGLICFRGVPLGIVTIAGFPDPLDFGNADTLVRRNFDPFDRCDLPSPDESTVDIAVERLSLESCQPITVTFNGGQNPEEWNVRVEVLDSSNQPAGSTLTATKEHCNGGTFDSQLSVCPEFVFSKADNPGVEVRLDVCNGCNPIDMTSTNVDWVTDPGENIELISPICTDFYPGLSENIPVTDCDCNNNDVRDACDVDDQTSGDCNNNDIPDECEVPQSAGCPIGTCTTGCVPDCNQNCVPDSCDPDPDNDGLVTGCDNCPNDFNPGQEDGDNDGAGDACDADADGDGYEGPNGDGQDCDDSDPNVNPGVEESEAAGNCDDGIDNDCDGDPDHADPDCPLIGACCLPIPQSACGTFPQECIIERSDICADLGGVFLGHGTECEHTVLTPIHSGGQWSHTIQTVTNCPQPGGGEAPCVEGPHKIDPWVTAADPGGTTNCEDFGHPEACPVPADFFGPGSDPFNGAVCFRGVPLGVVTIPGFPDPLDFGDADTLVRRAADPFDRCDPPSPNPETVDIVIERLDLESCESILVTFNGGQNPEAWDVRIQVSSSFGQPPGSTLTATRTHCNGGTFDSFLTVCPTFVFTKVDPPFTVLQLDFCADCNPAGIEMTATGVDWVSDIGENVGLVSPVCSDFHPGIADQNPLIDCDCNENGSRDSCDLEDGTSLDCNANEIPDDCEPDCDGDGIPDECDLCGDLDNDDDIDGADFAIFLTAFGHSVGQLEYRACADNDGDGIVGLADYQAWLLCYRAFTGQANAGPPQPSDIGDMNGDGAVDGADIQPFVAAFVVPGSATFRERFVADINGDGQTDAGDIGGLVGMLIGPD